MLAGRRLAHSAAEVLHTPVLPGISSKADKFSKGGKRMGCNRVGFESSNRGGSWLNWVQERDGIYGTGEFRLPSPDRSAKVNLDLHQ